MGGTRQRHFDGTSLEPRKMPENAHAILKDGSPTIMTPVFMRGSGAPLTEDGGHHFIRENGGLHKIGQKLHVLLEKAQFKPILDLRSENAVLGVFLPKFEILYER